ncbi:MAG: 1-(5-phosphoribosyl)-5-[(5-phosphoribosylamino)methylideneamino] imidazole-4-carboxamide isomerase [Deltaproteobacteria bacterium]|nr:1-(5-phosphoribosyl)-5-[(5-phosphoribosylamino)methylideneamino] imidazole-4-carboxamide isomerase [Deltaproteobacteria bacterium]
MKILFAMDLLDGKCVRLTKGNFGQVKIYSEDPLKVLDEMLEEGARDFHVVDLNGAKDGEPRHLGLIKKIRKKVPGYLQIGGGVRTAEVVHIYREIGIDGIIIGTRAYTDPEFLPSLKCKGIVLGLDILHGKPMIMGWKKEAPMELSEVIDLAEKCGISALLVTAIEKDGTLDGPDFQILKEIMSLTQIPIIASGGVATLMDLSLLSKIGVYGVVLGKAIYEKKIQIKDAIKLILG